MRPENAAHMGADTRMTDAQRQAQLHADLQRERAARERGYRERALRLFPHVCASCSRASGGISAIAPVGT